MMLRKLKTEKMKKHIYLTLFVIQCFSINLQAQQILYVSPNKLQPDAIYNVLFYCTGTHFTSSKPSLKFTKTGFEYIPKILIHIQNDTSIKLMLSTNTYEIQSGIYDIVITDSIDSTMILKQGLEIIAPPAKPQLVSVSPDTCNRGDTITLRVVGRNTLFNDNNIQATAIYLKNDVICVSYKRVYYNDTTMDVSFRLLSKYFGLCDFFYWGNKESWMKYYGALYIKPPDNPIYISHLSEDTITRGKTCRFYIYGKNTQFSLITSKSSISLQGTVSTTPNSFTVVNDTLIDVEFTIPFIANGILHLWLNIPTYGVMQLFNCLQVINNPDMMPAILSVSPDTACQNSMASIVVKCKYTLLTVNNNANVLLNRNSFPPIQADSVFILNDTLLRAVFRIAKTSEPGKWDLMISNGFDGLFTADSIFNIIKEVGIRNRVTVEQMSISPNPMENYTVISFNNPDNKVFNLQITDLYGRSIYQNPTVKSDHIKLLRNEMKPGFYIVTISNDSNQGQMKLIVK
jgi:hypothetical protein